MTANVSLSRCETYENDKVKDAVKKSINNIGGLSKFFKKGDRVLLKVNLLTKKKPEEVTTTHPAVVKALAELLIDFGTSVTIGDSPGGPFTEGMLRGIYKASGMEDVARETGATLNYNIKSFEKTNPNGLLLKKLVMTDMLNDVDKVVSVAKLKTHGMMTFTGAAKNMFGTVPGIAKAEYHLTMPDYSNFADALLDICIASNPVLSVMDGIIGMEGSGPSSGDPRSLNVILASDSPYHLDKAACTIIDLPLSKVLTIKKAAERGLCTNDLSDIAFSGDPLAGFVTSGFKLPESSGSMFDNVPGFAQKFVDKHLKNRPVFDKSLCTGCGICAEACPPKVIKINNKKAEVDYSGCIRCFCCQELCPQKAVSIYRPRLMKMLKL